MASKPRAAISASFQSNWSLQRHLYLCWSASWESNRFSGFDSRASESLGFGYSLVHTPAMTLQLEGGPALRQTDFVTTGPRNTVAGRAAVNYAWSMLSNLKLSENMSYYNENLDGTFTANTALTMGLAGSLSVQAILPGAVREQPGNGAAAPLQQHGAHDPGLFLLSDYSGAPEIGFNDAVILDGHGVAVAVHGLADGKADPAFADAVFFNVRLFDAVETHAHAALQQLGVVEGAGGIYRKSVRQGGFVAHTG